MPKDFLKIQRRKISRNFQDFGSYITIRKSAVYLLKPLFESHSRIIYQIKLDTFPEIGSVENDYVFKMVNPDDTDLINQIEAMEEWLVGRMRPMLLTGAICMAVLQRDKVAAFYLASLEKGVVSKLHLEIVLGESDAFGEQITVHKAHRRRGLSTRLRYSFYTYLKERGITTVYGHRALDNIASKKSAQKYHYADLAKIQYVRFFSSRRLQYQPFLEKIIDTDAAQGNFTVNRKELPDAGRPSFPSDKNIEFSISASELVQRCSELSA